MINSQSTHSEEVFLQGDGEANALSQKLHPGAFNRTAEIQAKMDEYGGYTTAGLAIGAAGVSFDDMETYHDIKHLQEHALVVDRLIKLGQRWGIDAALIANSTDLQAKLANFPYDPRDPEADFPVDDQLVEETWELAKKLAAEKSSSS